MGGFEHKTVPALYDFNFTAYNYFVIYSNHTKLVR